MINFAEDLWGYSSIEMRKDYSANLVIVTIIYVRGGYPGNLKAGTEIEA